MSPGTNKKTLRGQYRHCWSMGKGLKIGCRRAAYYPSHDFMSSWLSATICAMLVGFRQPLHAVGYPDMGSVYLGRLSALVEEWLRNKLSVYRWRVLASQPHAPLSTDSSAINELLSRRG